MTQKIEFPSIESLREQDPPIIVGGGGSAFVWIRRDLATLVTDLSTIPNTAPHPGNPANYIVYRVDVNATLAVISKGDGSVAMPISMLNSRFHSTVFQ